MSKKVLWFSRYEMMEDQREALGDVEIKQVWYMTKSAKGMREYIDWADIIAIVAPIDLAADFLKRANGKPVIMPVVNERWQLLDPDTGKITYKCKFIKWERLDEVRIVKRDYIPD